MHHSAKLLSVESNQIPAVTRWWNSDHRTQTSARLKQLTENRMCPVYFFLNTDLYSFILFEGYCFESVEINLIIFSVF